MATTGESAESSLMTTLPEYCVFFDQIIENTLNFQTLAPHNPELKGNIWENFQRLLTFMLGVCDTTLNDPKSSRYEDVSSSLQSSKSSLVSFGETLNVNVGQAAANNSDTFYDVTLQQFVTTSEVLANVHRTLIVSLAQMLQKDIEESVKKISNFVGKDFEDGNALIEAFNQLSLAIANTAESCSFLGAQRFMQGQPREVLSAHLDTLNELNQEVTNCLNALLSSRDDSEQKIARIKAAAANLHQAVEMVNETRLREVEKVETMVPFIVGSVEQMINTRRSNQALDRAIQEDNKELFSESSATKRLQDSAQEAGIEITPAMANLANNADEIEFALGNIQNLVAKQELPLLKDASEKAGVKILDMSPNIKAVIDERIATLKRISKGMNDILGSKIIDLSSTMTNSDASGITVDEVLEGILESLAPQGDQALVENKKTRELREYIERTLRERKGGKADAASLGQIQQQLVDYNQEAFPKVADHDEATLERISVELDKKVREVHTHFLDASFDLSENGFGDGRQEKLFSACNKVSDVVEISTALLPVQFAKPTVKPEFDHPEFAEEIKAGASLFPTVVHIEGFDQVVMEPTTLKSSSSSSSLNKNEGTPIGKIGKIKSSTSSTNLNLQLEEENSYLAEIRRKKEEELKSLSSTVKRTVLSLESQAEEDATKEKFRQMQKSMKTSLSSMSLSDVLPLPVEEPPPVPTKFLAADNIWNEKGTVQFDDKGQVKAGNLNQLLLHLTLPYEVSSDSISGSAYFETFMITLQTFTTPKIFISKLAERFEVPPDRKDEKETTYLESLRTMKAKVCNILKKYVVQRYDQDLANNPELVEKITQFIETLVVQDSEYLANSLLKSLEHAAGDRKKNYQGVAQQAPTTIEKFLFSMFDPSAEKFEPFSPLNFSIKEVAEQMTLIDSKLFKTIHLSELNDQSWSKKETQGKSPNLLRFIEQANRVSVWVSYLILGEPNLQRRRKIMRNLVVLCECLKNLRNYHGVMAVLSGMSAACVNRLKYTKSGLPSKTIQMLESHEKEMSSASSFKVYRTAFRAHKTSPTVPFVGVLLSDLTFIEDGNPSKTEDGLINWTKRALLHSVLSEFRETQLFCRYTMPDNAVLRGQLIKSISGGQKSPMELYDISLQLEPRNAPPPQEDHFSVDSILQRLLNI